MQLINRKSFLSKTNATLLFMAAMVFFSFTLPAANAARPGSTPLTCSIDPVAPSVSAGDSVLFDATADEGVRYKWNFDGGAPSSSTANSVTVTYSTPGIFSVSLNVSAKGKKCSDTVTFDVTSSTNTPPTANANGPYAGTTGAEVSFSSAGSMDPDGTDLIYAWDFGDREISTLANPSHIYDVAAIYDVTLTVTDSDGASDSDTTTANITDPGHPPMANANGPYAGTTEAAVSFSSAGSTVMNATIDSYSWNFGDGSTSSDADPIYTYAVTGTYDISLMVTYSNGEISTDNTQASIFEIPAVSVNSTSQNGTLGDPVRDPVSEQPLVGLSGYNLFATNDLGMHCGDLDTRVSSILPPFNVLHAQVIHRGTEPDILTPADNIEVVYSAVFNPNDPILTGINSAGLGPVATSILPDGSIYKTNFWATVLQGAYDPFYPATNPFDPSFSLTPLAGSPFNVIVDVGLPMPDVELLHLDIPAALEASQQFMPGILAPYSANAPQAFTQFVTDQPFFIDPSFQFGYVSEGVNWYEAAGLPLTAYDDFGRENPWPLYRVQAKNSSGNVVASTDIVVPISGEANCGICHNAPVDGGNGKATKNLSAGTIATVLDDPQVDEVPRDVSLEYAADLNLVRLHDQKHGTALEDNTPVVCQSCHYTPALDLAQVGPKGPGDTDANGRQQTNVRSMSNVMHSHHGTLDVASRSPDDAGYDGTNLMFPVMPPAEKNDFGVVVNDEDRRIVLQETCYQCHPGRRTDCLRGAMANGGMLCQDCHGDMKQVGDDFTRTVGEIGGGFELAGDFYDHTSETPRVPWANEPGCGSCHTGDAMSNLKGTTGTVVNNVDADGNIDGIRLFRAFRSGDAKATPIVPANKRFAENVIEADNPAVIDENDPRIGNPMLYRVSKGHEGVFCEACHGATHGIWPNKNPNANDNVTATQLQGHTGTITECDTCHLPSAFEDGGELQLTMDGPHGMHAVGSTHWNTHHKEARQGGGANCRTCHGPDGEGTVLSRMAKDRTLECKDNRGDFCSAEGPKLFPKGHVVGCNDCHANHL